MLDWHIRSARKSDLAGIVELWRAAGVLAGGAVVELHEAVALLELDRADRHLQVRGVGPPGGQRLAGCA